MNIVMPMAGRGSRFAVAGYLAPKPLIEVCGRPMYAWAMDSLPLALAKRVVFICLSGHLGGEVLENDIRERYASLSPEILSLSRVTEGQASTVLAARDYIDNDDAVLIFNSDTYCRTGLEGRLRTLQPSVDGVLGVFRAPGDQWSFARTDGNGRVLETAEKRRISEWATTGLYHFRCGSDFVRHADAMIAADERARGEFYIAPVYNRLIAAGGDVRIDVAEEVWPLGTPEDLRRFTERNGKERIEARSALV